MEPMKSLQNSVMVGIIWGEEGAEQFPRERMLQDTVRVLSNTQHEMSVIMETLHLNVGRSIFFSQVTFLKLVCWELRKEPSLHQPNKIEALEMCTCVETQIERESWDFILEGICRNLGRGFGLLQGIKKSYNANIYPKMFRNSTWFLNYRSKIILFQYPV